jgi:hypothetical protein
MSITIMEVIATIFFTSSLLLKSLKKIIYVCFHIEVKEF